MLERMHYFVPAMALIVTALVRLYQEHRQYLGTVLLVIPKAKPRRYGTELYRTSNLCPVLNLAGLRHRL